MANQSLNSRIGTVVNLPTGATYDLLQIKFINGFPQSKLVFGIEDTTRKVTGIQKVAQVFLKLLFTSRGSNVIYPDQGTYFSSQVLGSNIALEDTIFKTELTVQIRSAESQTKAVLNTLDSDEASMLRSVSLIGIENTKESLTVYMRMLTEAGEQAQMAIPFPELDLPRSN